MKKYIFEECINGKTIRQEFCKGTDAVNAYCNAVEKYETDNTFKVVGFGYKHIAKKGNEIFATLQTFLEEQ